MKSNWLLSAIFAMAGIALVSMMTETSLISEVHATGASGPADIPANLMERKLATSARHLDDLSLLKRTGIEPRKIDHMRRLMQQKIESERRERFASPQRLMVNKFAATIRDMQQLDVLQPRGLADRDIERIRQAMLHKLVHLQHESRLVSFY